MNPDIRVLGLLREIIQELERVREQISKSDQSLLGVLDPLIMKVRDSEIQFSKESKKISFKNLGDIIRISVYLVDIIDKWTNTLSYKLVALATANKMSEERMAVGKNIKLFRINAGLKQKELAASVGVEVSYLSSIENEKREPSLSLLKKIAESLSIPISIFFWENIDSSEGDTSESRLKKLLFELAKTTSQLEKR